MAGQLVFPFGVEPAFGRGDFIPAPCNQQAFDFIARWPDWPARAAALYGPMGCGKSHLAAIWAQVAGARTIVAHDLSELPPGPEQPLVIEDVDGREPDGARDRAMLGLFERPESVLLLTGRTPPAAWPVAIGDLQSRFQSLLAFPLWAPDDTLLAALVEKHFSDRQLHVPPAVVARIVHAVERTPDAIGRFVARADEKALAEKRAVSERLILALLETQDLGHQRG